MKINKNMLKSGDPGWAVRQVSGRAPLPCSPGPGCQGARAIGRTRYRPAGMLEQEKWMFYQGLLIPPPPLSREGGMGYNRKRSHKQQAASRPPQRKAKRKRQTQEETRRKQREEGGITPKARRSQGGAL